MMELFRNNPVLVVCPNQNQQDKEIHSTKDKVIWNSDNAEKEIIIEIDSHIIPADEEQLQPDPDLKKESSIKNPNPVTSPFSFFTKSTMKFLFFS